MRKRIRLNAGPLARIRYAATSTASKILAVLGALAILGGAIWLIAPTIPQAYQTTAAYIDHHGSIIRDDISISKELTQAPETVGLLTQKSEGNRYLTITRQCVDAAPSLSENQRAAYDAAAAKLDNSLHAFFPSEADIRGAREEIEKAWKNLQPTLTSTGDTLPEACATV